MNLEKLRRNKVRVAVGVVALLAVVGGAYLVFAGQEPVEISNAEELQQIRESPSGNYVLVDDIDLSHIDNFEPIGGFTGTFDGNGHTISNLTIDSPETDRVGLFDTVGDNTRLFGLVGSEGEIKNISLRGVDVTGGNNVGGLVGLNRGMVTDSSAEGEVSGNERIGGLVGSNHDMIHRSGAEVSVTGERWVGGLVGVSENPDAPNIISMSYATGDVSGGDTAGVTGGLVGANIGEVRSSYATGDVSGGGGGLAGYNVPNEGGGIIRNSYATGNVTGDGGGGLVAGNDGVDENGEIENSYATGRVTGEDTGGLVGKELENDGDVNNSYWNINSTGQETSAGGTPLTTEEMTGSEARENMDGFDFGETWETVTDPDDYPRLAWEVSER